MRSIVRRVLALHDRAAARLRAFAVDPEQPDPDALRTPTVSWSLASKLEHDADHQDYLATVRAKDAALVAELNGQAAELEKQAIEQERRWAGMAHAEGWN